MKLYRSLLSSLGSILLAASVMTPAVAGPDAGQITYSVGRLMEHGHFSRRKLDDGISRQLLQNYLEALDYRRLFFTQEDVDALMEKYGDKLDDDIILSNTKPAVEIFELYRKRVEDRVAKVKEWIKNEKFDFTSKREVMVNRQKAPWPKDEAEADQLWHDWLEYEFLQQKLDGKDLEASRKTLDRRYNQLLRFIREETPDDAVNKFLSCLAQTFDPHSEYMSKKEMENFNISMGLKLVGIGAVLQSEDGYAKIRELVPGGPAALDNRLRVGDKISAVAQGDNDFVDVVDMKLDKVVEMIRGKKGTVVRIEAIPADAADPSARKVVEIVRDEVKLKDKEAKAEIIEKKDSKGHIRRIGWITLPSFYADMESKDGKSTTKDVSALLRRLIKEDVAGIVLDLRNNGGGSLEEAINLTNLFVKNGPVVQVKNTNGRVSVSNATKGLTLYDGPLIVLTNSLSASASEIVAGALQDYGRAVVVGDRHTYGKGTVQTLLNVNRVTPFLGGGENEAGGLKLTIQKFYRIAGGSTQLKGVESDIILPSIYDQNDIGEKALKNPLPYDEVSPVPYEKYDRPLFIEQLKERSLARVNTDPEFKYVRETLKRLEEKIAKNTISLNEKVRRDEIAKEKARKKAITAERAKRKAPAYKEYLITLDNVNKPELELVKYDPKKAKEKKTEADATDREFDEEEEEVDSRGAKIDPVRNETINILNDLIDLSRSQKTASATSAAKPKE